MPAEHARLVEADKAAAEVGRKMRNVAATQLNLTRIGCPLLPIANEQGVLPPAHAFLPRFLPEDVARAVQTETLLRAGTSEKEAKRMFLEITRGITAELLERKNIPTQPAACDEKAAAHGYEHAGYFNYGAANVLESQGEKVHIEHQLLGTTTVSLCFQKVGSIDYHQPRVRISVADTAPGVTWSGNLDMTNRGYSVFEEVDGQALLPEGAHSCFHRHYTGRKRLLHYHRRISPRNPLPTIEPALVLNCIPDPSTIQLTTIAFTCAFPFGATAVR